MTISRSLPPMAAACAAVAFALAAPALGADADWIKPVEEGVTSLTESLTTIAAPILGVCLAGYGIWAIMIGRIEFPRLWIYLIAGLFIGAGPTFATWFMGLLKG